MDEVLKALRDILVRYAMASAPVIAEAVVGDTEVSVLSSRKFFEGETVLLARKSDSQGLDNNGNKAKGQELVIDKIIDRNTISFTTPLVADFTLFEECRLQKSFNGQFLKRVYIGDPSTIPDFPAITITGDDRNEEWWTHKSTKATWACTLSVLFEDSEYEEAYLNMVRMSSSVEKTLWTNRWPIFGKLVQTNLAADISAGDKIITLDSTAGIQPGHNIILEDIDFTDMNSIKRVIDDTRVELTAVAGYDYMASLDGRLIVPSRWVMWTYPPSTTYGYVHKGSLLKAAQIRWQAEEEIVRSDAFPGPVSL